MHRINAKVNNENKKAFYDTSIKPKEDFPNVSLKYFNDGFECFSEWGKKELKGLTSFIKKLRNSTWQKIFNSGGKCSKNSKNGFALTTHKGSNIIKRLSGKLAYIEKKEIIFFELRTSGKARVHGFKQGETFFLILLDRNHKLY